MWRTRRFESTTADGVKVIDKYHRYEEPREETDEQVLSRKAEEASYDPEYYAEMRGDALTGALQSFNAEEAMERSSAPRPRGSGTSAVG